MAIESSTRAVDRKLEWVVNIALIAAGILFPGALTRWAYSRRNDVRDRRDVQLVKVGTKLNLPNPDWGSRTVLFVLSNECHFCSESAPFYRKLVRVLAARPATRVIAVFPQSVNDGQRYLRDLGVSVDSVRQADLASIEVPGTPTLIMVDSNGAVTNAWLGKLDTNQELEVYEQLGIQQDEWSAADRSITKIEASALKQALARGEHPIILDVGNRYDYAKEHVPVAINIPFDELEARAENELSTEDPVVVYCHGNNDDLSERALELLHSDGFTKISVLKGGISEWRAIN